MHEKIHLRRLNADAAIFGASRRRQLSPCIAPLTLVSMPQACSSFSLAGSSAPSAQVCDASSCRNLHIDDTYNALAAVNSHQMHQLPLCSTACLLMTPCTCSIEYAPPCGRWCCVCCCRHRLVRPIHGSSHLRPSLQQWLPEGFLGRASFSKSWESCIGICRLTSLMPPILWCKQVVAVFHVLWVHAGSADPCGRHDLVDRRLHVSALSLAAGRLH